VKHLTEALDGRVAVLATLGRARLVAITTFAVLIVLVAVTIGPVVVVVVGIVVLAAIGGRRGRRGRARAHVAVVRGEMRQRDALEGFARIV
jgi:hypothetical protein